MRTVLDTNLLVSALLRPHSTSATILRLVVTGDIALVADDRILLEYEEVVLRARLGIDRAAAREVYAFLRDHAEIIVPNVFVTDLPDADDAVFIETAVSGNADCLVTGNKKHFPARACCGVPVLSPREFIEAMCAP